MAIFRPISTRLLHMDFGMQILWTETPSSVFLRTDCRGKAVTSAGMDSEKVRECTV